MDEKWSELDSIFTNNYEILMVTGDLMKYILLLLLIMPNLSYADECDELLEESLTLIQELQGVVEDQAEIIVEQEELAKQLKEEAESARGEVDTYMTASTILGVILTFIILVP